MVKWHSWAHTHGDEMKWMLACIMLKRNENAQGKEMTCQIFYFTIIILEKYNTEVYDR
jgi:hypothetical protein